MNHRHRSDTTGWWRSRTTWVLLGFLAIAGFFLFTEHRAHALGLLPGLLLLVAFLLHLYGHAGRGHDAEKGARP